MKPLFPLVFCVSLCWCQSKETKIPGSVRTGATTCKCLTMPYRPEPPCLKQCSAKAALRADRDTLSNVLGLPNSEVEKIIGAQAKLKGAKNDEELAAAMERELGSAVFADLTGRVEKLEGQQEKIVAWSKLTGGDESDALRVAIAERERLTAEMAAAKRRSDKIERTADRTKTLAHPSENVRFAPDAEKEKLRLQLMQQINTILETRYSNRGLVVNLSDVLFEPDNYTLRPAAREKLNKVSGILLAHPGLEVEVQGHTDNAGSDAYNRKLAEMRSAAVREYLINSGFSSESITALGLGKSAPVASNDTAAGRQSNRRVELVVKGDAIGTKADTKAF